MVTIKEDSQIKSQESIIKEAQLNHLLIQEVRQAQEANKLQVICKQLDVDYSEGVVI